jgi:hypothetical protein
VKTAAPFAGTSSRDHDPATAIADPAAASNESVSAIQSKESSSMSTRIVRLAVAFAGLSLTVMAQSIGPSTSIPPYMLPNDNLPPGSVSTTSLLTAADSVGGYRMVGIPDGMGGFATNGTITFVSNHELGAAQGIARAHGSTGAFISRWTMNPATMEILSGRDHNTAPADVHPYDRSAQDWTTGTFAFDRFCSADLPEQGAYQFGSLGTPSRILLNGEETRPPFATRHGSAWAHVLTGPATSQTWELPHLGQCSWENAVASPYPQAKTIVMCLDDSDAQTNPALTTDPSEIYVYIGQKQSSGNDITRAGLAGGTLYGVRVRVNGTVVAAETNAGGIGAQVGTFELVNLGDASTFNGAAQQTMSIANDILRMQRVEDGSWDPRPGHENDFYVVTTASTSTNSRLWRLRFTDITQPELGGLIYLLLNGSEGQQMFDNLCCDAHGRVMLQEDPGSAARLAKMWMYDIETGRLIEIAAANPTYFQPGSPAFQTNNEESSGVFPAFDLLGDGWYLGCLQNPSVLADPEIVVRGQFLAFYVDPTLGREFDLWFTSPGGPGSIQMHHRWGTPNAAVFTGVAMNPGSFPFGWFYGIDLSFGDLLTQANFGPPFLATLNGQGSLSSPVFAPLASGLELYAVALDDVFSPSPRISDPVSYVIP